MSQNDIEIWSLDFKHQEKPDELALFCYIIQNEKKQKREERESIWTRLSNIYCPLKNSSSICWNVSFQPFFHFTPELGTNPYVFYTQIVLILISGNTQLWFTLWCLSLKGILLRYKQVQGLTVQKIRLVTFKKLLQCAYLFWNGKKTMILKFVDY